MKSNRTDIENTFHHIISKGIERKDIFLTDYHKYKFLEFLIIILSEANIDILAYIIMNNHFHLFVERLTTSMANFMQRLLTKYAMWYNSYTVLKNGKQRTGHVFERRYWSSLIDTDKYFSNLMVYIHKNIVKVTGDENFLYEYKWSSFKDILNFDNRVVNINKIIEVGRFNKNNFLEEFKAIHSNKKYNYKIKYNNIRGHNILGTKKFKEEWMEKLKEKSRGSTSKRHKIVKDDVFNYIEEKYKVSLNVLIKNKINSRINNYYCKIIYFLLNKYCNMKFSELGVLFKKSGQTISKNIISLEKEKKNITNDFINFINTKYKVESIGQTLK